jgi:hypothetical protein
MKKALRAVTFLVAGAIAITVACPRVATTFDVSAETEWVEFIPGPHPRSDWSLEAARIFAGEDTIGRIVSGSLTLSDSVQVIVERRSFGPLLLRISPRGSGQLVGDIERPDSGNIPLSGYTLIEIPDIDARAHQGAPIVLPVKGVLIAGRTIEIETDPSPARLRNGRVTSFGRSIFGWAVFPAGTVDLGPGDQVVIQAQRSSAYGMIAADEGPALTVGYRAIAKSVEVRRPGGSHYRIGTTLFSRLRADPVLQSCWLALAFLLVLRRKLLPHARLWSTRTRKAAPGPVS